MTTGLAAGSAMTINTLQALRGLAALGVVLFHEMPFESKYLPGPAIVPQAFASGWAGVDLFFVLSGFLAVWTTRERSGPAAAGTFLLRRVTRIYPLYWLFCLPLLLVGGGDRPTERLASLLLLPNPAAPLLLVAWTLEFEIYFYLVFAALIWWGAGRPARLRALLVWGGIVVLGRWIVAPARADALLDALLSPLVLEFLIGCCAGYLCAKPVPWRATVAAGGLGVGLFVAGLLAAPVLSVAPWPRVLVLGSGGGLLLIGCVGSDALLCRWLPALIMRIGDASYSLYLSHLFVLALVGRFLRALAPHSAFLSTPAAHALVLGTGIAAALAVAELSYRWIERPILRLGRHLLRPVGAAHPAPAG